MRALCLVGLDTLAKTLAPDDVPVGPYAPAYLLQDLDDDPGRALDQAYWWSNGEEPGCRGRIAADDAAAYNGPSLAVGDVVALMRDPDGAMEFHRCATLGFAPCTVPETLDAGDYRVPHASLERVITPGSSWATWIPLMEQLALAHNRDR